MFKRIIPAFQYLFTGKAPLPIQQIVFKFIDKYGNTPEPLDNPASEERFNSFGEFSEHIAPYLRVPYLPDFLNPKIGFGEQIY